MKLKEKFAKQYAIETGDETDAEAWLTGFEKALTMASELVGRNLTDNKTYANELIPKLGEKEVEWLS